MQHGSRASLHTATILLLKDPIQYHRIIENKIPLSIYKENIYEEMIVGVFLLFVTQCFVKEFSFIHSDDL